VVVVTWKAVTAAGLVVAGVVAALSVYTFGWRGTGDADEKRASSMESTPSADKTTSPLRLYTSPYGTPAVFDPVTNTQCEVSGEGGIPNLFCTHRGARHRYEVVFWNDQVSVFDLAAPGEPMAPQFSVPARLKPGQRYAPR
jgi:hypothetical protein